MRNETVNTCQKDIRSGSKRDTILFKRLANVLLSNEKQKRQQAEQKKQKRTKGNKLPILLDHSYEPNNDVNDPF